MTRLRITTYQDAIDHLVDYVGSDEGDQTVRFARRAAQDAYNKFPGLHNWSYLYSRGRVTTQAQQVTGTIQYTNSTRTVTLTGATWPSWVLQGVVVINNIPYQVASNPTATTVTLRPETNPGNDVAAGTLYTLYQDAYSLPIDFVSCDEIININYGLRMSFEHPEQWLLMQRIYRGPATPRIYSIIGSTAYIGAMSLRFYPAPDIQYFMDFVYKRRLRPLVIAEYATGTAGTTSGLLTVTGNGTVWDSSMVGSTIRFSAVGNSTPPTGPSGENPFSFERTITAVASNTSLTVDADPGLTASGLTYAISDPLDIEEGSMLSFFWRVLEKQMRLARRMEPVDGEETAYNLAMQEAMEYDNRSTMRQAVGAGGYPRRLRDFPGGPDMGI